MKTPIAFCLLAAGLVSCATTVRAEDAPVCTSCAACMLPTTTDAVAAASVPAAPVATKAQTTCPVMKGSAINKQLFVDYQGKRIYVCCRSCVAIVSKDPATIVRQMEAAGITLAAVPASVKK